MAKLVDLVKINCASTGPGAITLGTAVLGYRGVERLTNGEIYSYAIQQGSNYEYGRATYLVAGQKLVRSPIDSSIGGGPLDLQPNATVAFPALVEDLADLLGQTAMVQAVIDAVNDNVGAVQDEGAAQVGIVTAAGATQVGVVNAAGAAFLASITSSLAATNVDVRATPVDPVGLWAMDSLVAATTTKRAYVPNLALGAPAGSPNWALAPRRAFANPAYWYRTGVTVTDRAVADENGATEAAAVAGVGAWFLDAMLGIPAGQQFTIVATVMRNAGTDQQFALTRDLGATRQAFTATDTYQRFAYTFSGTGLPNRVGLCSIVGGGAANLAVSRVEIFAGAADLGAQASDGNIYTGTGGLVSGVFTGGGYVALPTRYNYSKWTVCFVAQRNAGNNGWVLTDATSQNAANFGVDNAQANPVRNAPSGAGYSYMLNRLAGQNGVANRGGLWNFETQGLHMFTHTFDGSAVELWCDDIRMFRQEASNVPLALRDFMVALDPNAASSVGLAGLMGVWDRALSATEIRQFHSYQRLRNPLISLPGLRSDRVLVVEGDSIQGGFAEFCWPWVVAASLTKRTFGSVYALSGGTLANMVSRAAMVDGVLPSETHSRTFMLTVGIGTNDLGIYVGGAAQYITDLRAYCTARAAAGWDVMLWTLITENSAPGSPHNTRRAVVNADIRANWALYGLKAANRVLDVAADPNLGTDTSQADHPELWANSLHPSAAGQAIYASIAAATMNTIA